VGSFSKGGGVLIGQSSQWVFNKFICEHQQDKERKKEKKCRGTPSDDCDSVRIGFSVLRIECPIAPGTQKS